MRRWVATLGLVLVLTAPAMAQGLSGHDSPDPKKCKKCKPALDKAVSYVRKNYRGSKLGGKTYAGLMFLIMGETGGDLQDCVRFAEGTMRNGGYNRNWHLGMAMYFLSEYNVRYPGAAASALNTGVGLAPAQQEPTGGWCHHLGMWKKNKYNKRGGGQDLGIVTSMLYGAFWNMKAVGMEVPQGLMDKTHKNLESISQGAGFGYGTDNRHADFALSRAAYTLLGLANARAADHPFYSGIVSGLPRQHGALAKCHSFAPLHHYSVAAAMHRIGNYGPFAAEWIDKLIARQKDDGTVHLEHDDNKRDSYDRRFGDKVANAAVFAIILLLQQPDAFQAPEKKKKDKPQARPGGSPFGNKNKGGLPIETGKEVTKPEPAEAPAPAPVPPPARKKSPFGRKD